jgi:hypothetical protein
VIECVEPVRPVQFDPRDPAFDRNQNEVLLRHRHPPNPAFRIVIAARVI